MASKTTLVCIASLSPLGTLPCRMAIAFSCVLCLARGLAEDPPQPIPDKPVVEIRLRINADAANVLSPEPSADSPSVQARQIPAFVPCELPEKPGIQRIPHFSLCVFQSGGAVPLGSTDQNSKPAQPIRLPDDSKLFPLKTEAKGQIKVGVEGKSLGLQLTDSGANGQAKPDIQNSDAAVQGDSAPAPDPKTGTKSATGECPGSPESDIPAQESQPNDIPLEQDEHPYDAPAAESSPAEPPPAIARIQDFSPSEILIRDQINACLKYYIDHPETVVRRGPWALMHATLPFGVESEVVAGNRRVNTIGWMCYNGVCAKQRMFQPTQTGFRTNVGPGVQGHEGQFLAILAQSKVQSSYPLLIGKRQYTVRDLAHYEMSTCRESSELTFKLIGLSFYLQQNQTWRDNRGRSWNLEKMVAEELAQPINGAACGGTHRLMGLSYALIRRQQAGFPVTGSWAQTERYLNDYVNYAMTLQNADGSFSTEWFESRGQQPDVERKVQTTGHILEWLIFTLPDEHLRSQRVQLSVRFLLDTVGANPGRDWPIGPRGHVLRALALYNQRVFGAEPGKMKAYIAEHAGPSLSR